MKKTDFDWTKELPRLEHADYCISLRKDIGICDCGRDEKQNKLFQLVQKAISHALAEWEQKWQNKLFDLYQSHDCDNDTACKFEDRLGDLMQEKPPKDKHI